MLDSCVTLCYYFCVMNNQVIKSDFRLNEERQTYSVTIKDKNTGETIQQYDTKIALIFGVSPAVA